MKIIAEEMSEYIERGNLNDDTSGIFDLFEYFGSIKVFDKSEGKYIVYADTTSEGKTMGSGGEVSNTLAEGTAREGVLARDKQDIRKSDGLRVSGSNGKYNLIEATKEDVGFIPIASGSYEEIKAEAARYDASNSGYDSNAEIFRDRQDDDTWYRELFGLAGKDEGYGEVHLEGARRGQASDRTADTAAAEGDTAAVRRSERRREVNFSREDMMSVMGETITSFSFI
ncbi:MAG: hypothetical protein IJU94_03680 [Clostridia bacterium]|nr:hypothetical protein [Clostridia bacterium]